MPACCLGINTELKNYDFFLASWDFFSKFSPFLHSPTVLSCRCYRGANLDVSCCTEQRGGCFQSVEKGVMIHKQPFSGSKTSSLPIQHHHYPYWFPQAAAAPQQADTKRGSTGDGRAQPSPLGRNVSPWWSRSSTGEKQPWATKISHCGPQHGLSLGRGQSCLCGADGAIPVATSVPTTQSQLLFYGHEKLGWMVKVSHSKCWYEAL